MLQFEDHIPSTGGAAEGPAVVAHAPLAERDGRIVWWEERTAYDRRITRYRETEGAPETGLQDFTTVWLRGWGTDHVVDALTGPTAVVLSAALPAPERSLPENYALAATCGAAQARIGGGALGADADRVGPNGLKTPAAGGAQPQQPQPTKPRSTDPDF